MNAGLDLQDEHPSLQEFREEVIHGLRLRHKRLPSKYFYDARGSALFDEICELPEYYVTRTELGILERHVAEMAQWIGPRAMIVEPGSGSGNKTHLLLEALEDPVAYVPVEISREHLMHTAEALRDAWPGIEILPVCADFTANFGVPNASRQPERTVVYFPGSTIGNFDGMNAKALLDNMREVAEPDGGLLVGVDLRKDRATLEAAYNDAQGITAAFNLNLLERINAELGGDFDLDAFEHRAVWDDTEGRIEMRLVSKAVQRVSVGPQEFEFARGEYILTEYSYKYTLDGFARLAGEAGFSVRQVWTDPDGLFSLQYLEVALPGLQPASPPSSGGT